METSGLDELIKLAKFAGGRFDLVQAGGGNVSWKSPQGEMLIKTSGISMSEMASENQCAKLNTQTVLNILRNESILQIKSKSLLESNAQKMLDAANLTPHKRPSIETFFHVMLHPFTLHTHPIAVNHLVIRKDAKEIIQKLFPESVFVNYATPGIELALELDHAISIYVATHHKQPQVVFLKNHGLLVSADSGHKVQDLTHAIVTKIEQALSINYQHYHLATHIATLFNETTKNLMIAYLSEDQKIQQIRRENPGLFKIWPTSPDAFVFNGFVPCELKQLNILELQKYFDEYGFFPKVIIYQDHVFFISETIRKAKEMEDVFKFHLMALYHADGELEPLSREELLYLAGWEAEKFRQKQ